MPVPDDDQIAEDANYRSPEEAKKHGREIRFRLSVVAAWYPARPGYASRPWSSCLRSG
jgi:hypothetical protein